MSQNSTIEWTDATWSPLRVKVRTDAAAIAESKGYTSLIQIGAKMAGRVGQHCEHVSDGCKLCYSGTWQARCLKSGGTGLPFDRRSRDLVEPFVDEKTLLQPLKWRQAKKVFVENQSDLFGEWYTDEQIDWVFAVMALDYDMHWTEAEGNVRQPHHTWQILTKRPERMLAYISRIMDANKAASKNWFDLPLVKKAVRISQHRGDALPGNASLPVVQWVADGMPGLWLGVSVENQATADERILLLLQTPAAVRFVSYEPALGPIEFRDIRQERGNNIDALRGGIYHPLHGFIKQDIPHLDWVIVGGESGPGARPFEVAWARSTVQQCRSARVACFVKQLGRNPGEWVRIAEEDENPDWFPLGLKSSKGSDMSEWPEDLRVREFPKC